MDKDITLQQIVDWAIECNIPLNTPVAAIVGDFGSTLKRVIYDGEDIICNPMGTHLYEQAEIVHVLNRQ